MLAALAMIILAYFLGAIPTGYWLAKALKGIDIRQFGSGSIGTTNVLRACGKRAAAFVFAVDISKGFVAVWLSIFLADRQIFSGLPLINFGLLQAVVALTTLVGHSKSIFLRFQGGKSAATALGCAMAMNLAAAGESFAVWLIILATTRLVSLASMVAVTLSSLIMYFNHARWGYVLYTFLGAIYVVACHRSNIQRILAGQEPRLGEQKKESLLQAK